MEIRKCIYIINIIFDIGYDAGNTICLITPIIIMCYVCIVCYRSGPIDNELRQELGHNRACWKLRSKENKRLAWEHRASDWNKTKHRAVYTTTYGLLVQHLYSISFSNECWLSLQLTNILLYVKFYIPRKSEIFSSDTFNFQINMTPVCNHKLDWFIHNCYFVSKLYNN